MVLLADATRRVAGRGAALAVGILLALFQPTTFFDGLILPESLLCFVESLLVWFVARNDWRQAGWRRFAVYGHLVGVLAEGRASYAVLMALVPLLDARGSASRGAGLHPLPTVIYESYLALQRDDLLAARRAIASVPPDAAPTDPVLAGFLVHSRDQLAAVR